MNCTEIMWETWEKCELHIESIHLHSCRYEMQKQKTAPLSARLHRSFDSIKQSYPYTTLEVIQPPEGNAYVNDLYECTVSNVKEVCKMIEVGLLDRLQFEKLSNRHYSKRSHTILQIRLAKIVGIRSEDTTYSHLMIVELAGSEIPKHDEDTLSTMDLQVLGNCIHKIHRGDTLIPFKNSKLTRLLQHCMNKICLLAAVDAAPAAYEDTRNTLLFANKCKNAHFMNQEKVSPEEVKRLKDKIKALESEKMDLEKTIETMQNKFREEKLALKNQIEVISKAYEESTNRPFVSFYHERITPDLKREVEEELREDAEKRIAAIAKQNEALKEKLEKKEETIKKLQEMMISAEERTKKENHDLRTKVNKLTYELNTLREQKEKEIKKLEENHNYEMLIRQEQHQQQLDSLNENLNSMTEKLRESTKQQKARKEYEKTLEQKYKTLLSKTTQSKDQEIQNLEETYKAHLKKKDEIIAQIISEFNETEQDYQRQITTLQQEVQLLFEYASKLCVIMTNLEHGVYPVQVRFGLKTVVIDQRDKPAPIRAELLPHIKGCLQRVNEFIENAQRLVRSRTTCGGSRRPSATFQRTKKSYRRSPPPSVQETRPLSDEEQKYKQLYLQEQKRYRDLRIAFDVLKESIKKNRRGTSSLRTTPFRTQSAKI